MLYVIDTYAAKTYMELTMTRLQTVVELPEFQRRAKVIMSDQEREATINFIAANPEAGISLGGGLRKVRIPREGSGKSGGFRTVYVFGGTHMPRGGRGLSDQLISSGLLMKDRREDGKTEALYS